MERKLILDFFEEYRNFSPEMIERELKINITEKIIVSIIGPRRAGKTYYLLYLRKFYENPLYLNFEDSRLMGLSFRDLREVVRIFIENYGKPDVLLLDEIQNLKGWEVILRELHDLKKHRIVITGSSSKLLSKEIATQLRGRTLSYLLLPFSFREFLRAKGVSVDTNLLSSVGRILSYLRDYIEWGGFPEIVVKNERERILKEYLELAFYKDFVERHEVKSISLASLLFNHILQNFSNEFSVKSIAKKIKSEGMKFNINTLYKYVEHLEDTLFVFFLKRYSLKVHLRETWPKKVYLCDTGLTKVVRFSENLGKTMENVTFLELLRKTNQNPLMEIYYFKDSQGHEVDFVIKEGLQVKQLIQVTYANSFDEIDKREWRALLKAKDLLKCKNLTIITWDYEDEKEISWFNKRAKIKFIPLWKWLLSGGLLEK